MERMFWAKFLTDNYNSQPKNYHARRVYAYVYQNLTLIWLHQIQMDQQLDRNVLQSVYHDDDGNFVEQQLE